MWARTHSPILSQSATHKPLTYCTIEIVLNKTDDIASIDPSQSQFKPFQANYFMKEPIMVSKFTLLIVLKLSIAVILAAWVSAWILKPTQLWKRNWHVAEDWADAMYFGESGLNVIVFCFPLLTLAIMGYIYLYLCSSDRRMTRKRTHWNWITKFSNPIIVSSPIGVVSTSELLVAVLFIVFLAWTYYSNVSSDLKKMAPSKSIKLNRWQLKVMYIGVRFGSLTEACLVLLLLPVLRGMAVFKMFGIQFEGAIRYHVWLGNGILIFSVLHGITIMFVWGVKDSLWMEIRRWQRTGRNYLAGAIALIALLIIWITSLPPIRRKNFQFFYLVHHLYVVFIVFFLLHAGTGHFFLVLSGILLFALDKILRIRQSWQATCLISARLLPCRAVELTLPKHPSMKYTPTSAIFVKIPSISRFQWHPFTITSSSNLDDDRLSIMVKCQGPWTNSLYDKLQSIQVVASGHTKSLAVAVEGPYGPSYFPYQKYSSLLLIAGGVGITPFLSILQEIASRNDDMSTYPTKIQLIYAVKKSEDLSMLTPISTLLMNWSDQVGSLELKVFVTQEKEGSTPSLRELLQEMSQLKPLILAEHSNRDCVPMPEGLPLKTMITGLASLVFLLSLVCLNHAFIHNEKKSKLNKTPSWINDLLVICAFVIATSCSAMVTALHSIWRKPLKDANIPTFSHKSSESVCMRSLKEPGEQGEHEINFGKRPNFIDIFSKPLGETRGSEIGVFVCGPSSMQESVASFCRSHSHNQDKGNKYLYKYHPINFSL